MQNFIFLSLPPIPPLSINSIDMLNLQILQALIIKYDNITVYQVILFGLSVVLYSDL